MWQELAAVGVDPLTTPAQVDEALGRASGTVLVVVNSICGCAAGSARPGVMLALQHSVIPDRSVTVFAGVDRDAAPSKSGIKVVGVALLAVVVRTDIEERAAAPG
jgi:putative YphP/YqiW family bacilliredoxin